MQVDGLADLHTHGQRRVQGTHGLLKNHRNAVATHGTNLGFTQLEQVLPVKQDFAAFDLARRVGNQPQDRQGSDAFARARFAHDGQRLARIHVERHLVHGRHLALRGAKPRDQLAHAEQRFCHGRCRLRSPFSFSSPGPPTCAHESARGARRRPAVRRHSSSPRATRRCKRRARAARGRAPSRRCRASSA